jgi:hypothetical protein
MDLEDLENRINKNTKKLEQLTRDIEHNLGRINENKEKIEHNSGALALLHTIKSNGDKYFIIWLFTFIAFLISVGYIIYLHTDIERVTNTQEVEDVNSIDNTNIINGDNYG